MMGVGRGEQGSKKEEKKKKFLFACMEEDERT